MKEYKRKVPIIVVGGTTGDFLGEYMAGGVIIVLGITREGEEHDGADIVGDYVGTGMHGGAIFVRGQEVPAHKLGSEPRRVNLSEQDNEFLRAILKEFCKDVDFSFKKVMSKPFFKYIPLSHRPYGKVYAPQP